MRKRVGDAVGQLQLLGINGKVFDLNELKGRRYMLSFFRFAACPFCNLRMHELVQRFGEFAEGFTVVAIFDSPIENLNHYATRHQATFPVLADPQQFYYRAFAIERSIKGVFKAAIMRLPQVLQSVFVKRFVPMSIQGDLTTLPADFLVDEAGVIQVAYYGADIGDHLPLEQVQAFSGRCED